MPRIVADSPAKALSLLAAQNEDWVVRHAIALLERRLFKRGSYLSSPQAVRDYLRLKLVAEPNEVFSVIFLNNAHRILAFEPLFWGTINKTTVYPRVIIQRALTLNASAVVLAHQHPSGDSTPSQADEALTQSLKTALALVDVNVLDHFVVGEGSPYSFADHGLL